MGEAALERPDHVAVEAVDGTLTYAELDHAVDRCARRLAALGVGEGARVATTLPPSIAFCELLHALPRLRAARVPLNTRLPASEQQLQARTARAGFTVDRPLDGMEADVEPRRELDRGAVALAEGWESLRRELRRQALAAWERRLAQGVDHEPGREARDEQLVQGPVEVHCGARLAGHSTGCR